MHEALGMIDISEARRIVLDAARPLPPQRVRFTDALGRVLAEDVPAPHPMPRFDASAMDGFAAVGADVASAGEQRPVTLPVRETLQAGDPPAAPLARGSAVRIMTGAVVPPGADAVVPKEDTDDLGGTVRIRRAPAPGENIRMRGGEFAAGDVVLAAGTRVTPPVIGILAALGRTEVAVHGKPSAAVVVTGNEIRPPDAEISAGEIRDANSFALAAALECLGVRTVMRRIVGDDRKAIAASLGEALETADVALAVGGVSVGDFDFVKEAAEDAGVETLFWRIAMKPGKPNYFGARGRRLLFGLPGNPVSVLVSFVELVRPALARLEGAVGADRLILQAKLETDLVKNTPRLELVRGRLGRDAAGALTVRPFGGRDSHMLGSLAGANALILMPRDCDRLPAGAAVDVEPLYWGIS